MSAEQRQMMDQLGAPVPIFDEDTQQGFLLLPIDLISDPLEGFSASVRSFTATGSGDTAQEATLALAVLLRTIVAPGDARA